MSVARFWELLEANTGLRWTEGLPRATIGEHLQLRARELGLPSVDAYAAMFEGERVGSPEWQLVLDVATNGQTWFFRGEPQLTEFERAIRRINGAGRTPRVWSIACSTGEEVYTLAMLAAEADAGAGFLGTDLNTISLARAERGHYPASALQHVAPHRIDRFFVKTTERTFCVKPSAIGPVRFEKHNVVADYPKPAQSVAAFYPGADLGAGRPAVPSQGFPEKRLDASASLSASSSAGWDIIFCRNVFIYFADETIAKVGRALASVLHEDGLLFLGAAETFRNHDVPLEPVFFEGGVAFRRKRASVTAVRVPKVAAAPPVVLPRASPRSALTEGATAAASRLRSTPNGAAPSTPQLRATTDAVQAELALQLERGDIKAARAVAGREAKAAGSLGALLLGHVELRAHELDRALDAYLEAGRRSAMSDEAPYFQAVVYHKQRKWSESLTAAASAIRINPDCWPAHYLTIGLYARLARPEASADARTRTRTALGRGAAALRFETSLELLNILVPTPAQVLETLGS